MLHHPLVWGKLFKNLGSASGELQAPKLFHYGYENISQSGVIHLGISDHSLIYTVRNLILTKSEKISPMVREVRDFKNFVQNYFIHNVSQLPWDTVNQFDNPNIPWQVWKSFFLRLLIGIHLCGRRG